MSTPQIPCPQGADNTAASFIMTNINRFILPDKIPLICDRVLLGSLKAKCLIIELIEQGISFKQLESNENYVSKCDIVLQFTDILNIKLSRIENKSRYLFLKINESSAEDICGLLRFDVEKFDFVPSSEPWIKIYFSTKSDVA